MFAELVGDNISSFGVDVIEASGTLFVDGVEILNGFDAGDFRFELLCVFLVELLSDVDLRFVGFLEVFVIETLDVDFGVIDVEPKMRK